MKKYFILMGTLGLIEISLALWLTFWREEFWNYVAHRQLNGFCFELGVFAAVAITLCIVSTASTYFGNLAAISWRNKLNEQARLHVRKKLENIPQRIQEDCKEYPRLLINLVYGGSKALIYIFVFSIALVWQFHWWYLVSLIAYSCTSTWLAKKLATPLIQLNYDSQQAEATYRTTLRSMQYRVASAINLRIAKRLKKLGYFQILYAQVGVVIPLLIIAPEYFTSVMTIGMLMKGNSLMSTILENLSYGVQSFDSINLFMSCKRRLNELTKE